jgi:hypothetical protein
MSSISLVKAATAMAFGVLVWMQPSFAQQAPANSCADEARRLADQLRTSVDHVSAKGDEIFFQPKDKVELRFACPTGNQRFPRFHLTFKATYPPPSFWDVVADTGAAMTGASTRRVRLAGHQCHKAAVLTPDKRVQIRQHGLGVDCQVSNASGGMTSLALRRRVSPPR